MFANSKYRLGAQGVTGKNVGSVKNIHLYYKCMKQPH